MPPRCEHVRWNTSAGSRFSLQLLMLLVIPCGVLMAVIVVVVILAAPRSSLALEVVPRMSALTQHLGNRVQHFPRQSPCHLLAFPPGGATRNPIPAPSRWDLDPSFPRSVLLARLAPLAPPGNLQGSCKRLRAFGARLDASPLGMSRMAAHLRRGLRGVN